MNSLEIDPQTFASKGNAATLDCNRIYQRGKSKNGRYNYRTTAT